MGEVFAIGALALVGFLLWDIRPSAQKRRAALRLAAAAEREAQMQLARDNYQQSIRESEAREEARQAREHGFMIANKGYGKTIDDNTRKIETVLDENYPKVSDFYERLAAEGIELHTTEAHAVQYAWWQEREELVNALVKMNFSR